MNLESIFLNENHPLVLAYINCNEDKTLNKHEISNFSDIGDLGIRINFFSSSMALKTLPKSSTRRNKRLSAISDSRHRANSWPSSTLLWSQSRRLLLPFYSYFKGWPRSSGLMNFSDSFYVYCRLGMKAKSCKNVTNICCLSSRIKMSLRFKTSSTTIRITFLRSLVARKNKRNCLEIVKFSFKFQMTCRHAFSLIKSFTVCRFRFANPVPFYSLFRFLGALFDPDKPGTSTVIHVHVIYKLSRYSRSQLRLNPERFTLEEIQKFPNFKSMLFAIGVRHRKPNSLLMNKLVHLWVTDRDAALGRDSVQCNGNWEFQCGHHFKDLIYKNTVFRLKFKFSTIE